MTKTKSTEREMLPNRLSELAGETRRLAEQLPGAMRRLEEFDVTRIRDSLDKIRRVYR